MWALIPELGQPEATKSRLLVDLAVIAVICELEVREVYLGSKIGNALSP